MELELRRLRSVLDVESVYTAFVESYDKSFNFPGESHDIWEIGVVFSGCVGITSGAEVYECHPGEVIIHPPGVFHTAWERRATDDRHLYRAWSVPLYSVRKIRADPGRAHTGEPSA